VTTTTKNADAADLQLPVTVPANAGIRDQFRLNTFPPASGFPSFDTTRTAPGNVVLQPGDLSGSFVARYHPDRQRSMNEVQTCTGESTVAANWQHAGMFSGGKATVSGIVPGTTVWVRVRTAGLKGVMGEWSDPAKIIVV